MSEQTRRSFIKGSVSKTLIAANATIVAGLINTPGIAGADTTGPGPTQPGTTQPPVLIWEIRFMIALNTPPTGNFTDPLTGEQDAQAAGEAVAKAYIDASAMDATQYPNTYWAPKGTMQACFERSGASPTPIVTTVPSSAELGYRYQISIPAGSVKFIYYK